MGVGHIYQGDTSKDINSWLELNCGENKKDTPKGQSDLKAMVAALNETDLDLRYRRVAELLDIDRFMKHVAVSVVLNTLDAYPL